MKTFRDFKCVLQKLAAISNVEKAEKFCVGGGGCNNGW